MWLQNVLQKFGQMLSQKLSQKKQSIVLRIDRLFSTSDLHVDYEVNRRWLDSLSTKDHKNDYLIVAGDISGQLDLVKQTFEALLNRFKGVSFVFGNHDLWLEEGFGDSEQKHFELLRVMKSMGIASEEVHSNLCVIVPLMAWYDFTFRPYSRLLRQKWMDFRRVKWPEGVTVADITGFFLNENVRILDRLCPGVSVPPKSKAKSKRVVSFSHFVPRSDLLEGVRMTGGVDLRGVLGTSELDGQIRRLGSGTHIYGHLHANASEHLSGRNYCNTAFGYPREKGLRKGLFEVRWDEHVGRVV